MMSKALLAAPVSPADASPQEQDDTLRLAVVERLRSSGYLLLRAVRCDVTDGVVTLSGDVPSFHLKQVAQAVLLKIESVRKVRNLLEVR
jgi:osmotically-inducible protein OsmY